MYLLKQCNTEIIEVPVKVEYEVPVIVKEFDTVYKPQPVPYLVKEVDTTLIEEYKKANDSLKNELFRSAVSVNKYKETFEDSLQTITVDAEVTGKLNSMSVKYETKPKTIEISTKVPVKVPKNKISLSIYGETGLPTNLNQPNVVFKSGIDYTSKKDIIYGASFDTEKRLWLKIGYKFKF